MKYSIFREEEKEEGKPGPVSMRRVLAFILVLSAIGLFVGGFFISKESWYVFIPGIVCLAGSLLLLFFTTWSDVAEIAKVIKK
jgi:uncharacterized membrane protein